MVTKRRGIVMASLGKQNSKLRGGWRTAGEPFNRETRRIGLPPENQQEGGVQKPSRGEKRGRVSLTHQEGEANSKIKRGMGKNFNTEDRSLKRRMLGGGKKIGKGGVLAERYNPGGKKKVLGAD